MISSLTKNCVRVICSFSEEFQRVTAACVRRKVDSVHFAKNNLLTYLQAYPTRGNLLPTSPPSEDAGGAAVLCKRKKTLVICKVTFLSFQ